MEANFFFFKFLQKYYLCFQKLGALEEEQTSQLQETSLTVLPRLPLQVAVEMARYGSVLNSVGPYASLVPRGEEFVPLHYIISLRSLPVCLRPGGILVLSLCKHVTGTGCPAEVLTI